MQWRANGGGGGGKQSQSQGRGGGGEARKGLRSREEVVGGSEEGQRERGCSGNGKKKGSDHNICKYAAITLRALPPASFIPRKEAHAEDGRKAEGLEGVEDCEWERDTHRSHPGSRLATARKGVHGVAAAEVHVNAHRRARATRGTLSGARAGACAVVFDAHTALQARLDTRGATRGASSPRRTRKTRLKTRAVAGIISLLGAGAYTRPRTASIRHRLARRGRGARLARSPPQYKDRAKEKRNMHRLMPPIEPRQERDRLRKKAGKRGNGEMKDEKGEGEGRERRGGGKASHALSTVSLPDPGHVFTRPKRRVSARCSPRRTTHDTLRGARWARGRVAPRPELPPRMLQHAQGHSTRRGKRERALKRGWGADEVQGGHGARGLVLRWSREDEVTERVKNRRWMEEGKRKTGKETKKKGREAGHERDKRGKQGRHSRIPSAPPRILHLLFPTPIRQRRHVVRARNERIDRVVVARENSHGLPCVLNRGFLHSHNPMGDDFILKQRERAASHREALSSRTLGV
ncbi:hypothetical protein FB451DRAFT_1170471 [Mycena latifolia]|nr:hypothetical protein FB451DRAFT_1170471 [Mycena latifolia]